MKELELIQHSFLLLPTIAGRALVSFREERPGSPPGCCLAFHFDVVGGGGPAWWLPRPGLAGA